MSQKQGMLWLLGTDEDVAEVDIRAGIDYHRQKYPDTPPSAVYLNPDQMGEHRSVSGLPVRPDKTILVGNLFVAIA